MNNKKFELIPPPIQNWHIPEVRYAYVQGLWDGWAAAIASGNKMK